MQQEGIQRNLHPVFGILWAIWLIMVLIAIYLYPNPTFIKIVLLAFFPIELTGVALDTGSRDTLSETMTWLQRYLSKHRIIYRGWNAVITLMTVHISWLAKFLVDQHWSPFFGWITFALTTIFLIDHWFNPDVHG
tara:strand:+ start:6136 stop:6540 length:405 start_codon:yes stop_codon:yes gene_type:complete